MSFDVFEEYATDESLEVSGAWFPMPKGGRLLIARANNAKYNKMLMAQFERFKNILELNDEAADKKNTEIIVDCMAECVLLGWEGISYQKKPIDYSLASAKLLLGHKDFRQKVAELANTREAYLIKKEDEQGKA